MTTILYGNTWTGDSEPSSGVLAGQQWIKPTDGSMFYRDTTNTVWIFHGNINNVLGGAVQASGDTMTGPLLDAPNLPPLDSPNFLGTIDQDGFPVALKIDLAILSKRIYDQISSQVRSQFLSQFQQSAVAANIAFHAEVFTQTGTLWCSTGHAIPAPTFASDGATATDDQIKAYGFSLAGSIGTNNTNYFTLAEDSHRHVKATQFGLDSGTLSYPVPVQLWSFAVR
jgi:hypothetical protein